MMARLSRAAITLGVLAWILFLWSENAWSAGIANLSGTWKLNANLSDDPQQKMKDSTESGGSGSGGGGYGGGHHGGHRGGGRGGSGSSDDAKSAMENYNAAMQSLKIRHQDPELFIEDAAGHQHTLYTDGRKVEEERSFGGTTELHAVWKDGHVVVTTQSEHGRKTTETYSVTADGSQLTVTTKIDRQRGSAIEIKRVYDAVKPETTPAPTPSTESPAVTR
jgi:hypothetical protein